MNKINSAPHLKGPARLYLVVFSGLMLALFMLAPNFPRPGVAFPFLLGVASIYYFARVEKNMLAAMRGTEERWFPAALFGLVGYLTLNSLWSLATPAALGKSAFVLSIILLTLLVSRALARLPRETLERAAHLAVIGAIIGILYACFQILTDHYLERLIYTNFPSVRPGAKSIDVYIETNGHLNNIPASEYRKTLGKVVIRVSPQALNRNQSLLMLLLWPALFLCAERVRPKLAKLSTGVIAVAATVTFFAGPSQTAQVALLLSAAAFVCARYWPAFTRTSILSAWCIAVMLAMPLASAPYKAGLHTSERITDSFRDRMVIWDTTVELAKEKPWLGIGIRSTRILNKEMRKTQTILPGHTVPRRLGLHSHNQFLQIWFELGAIGALFILALGIGLLRGIERMGEAVRPFAYATFVAACGVAAFGWGLWQTWLLSGYALSVMMVLFINAYSKKVTARA